jgi:hypothetical protein
LRIAVPAGLLAGAATGVVARIMMRAFALADGMEPSFSIAGTIGVIAIFAVVLGAPLALGYFFLWRQLNLPESIRGLAYGGVLFIVLIAIPFMVIPSGEAVLRTRLVAIASFLPVPLTYGLAVARAVERLM